MDSDFSAGKNKKGIQIQPLNDLSAPKVPDFSAVDDDEPVLPTVVSNSSDTPSSAPEPAPDKPKKLIWSLNKKQRIIAAIICTVLIAGGGVVAWLNQPRGITPEPTLTTKPEVRKKPAPPVYGSLNGLPVDTAVNDRPVTGIMIENSADARPQSGMDQASLVFEAIAEGGITRFLTLYKENEPDYIGPVRSVRPYYLQWCMSFDCAIAHVGGSPEALQNIRDWGTKDLDQFYNAGAYWRIDSRYAPHNMYTNTANLRKLEADKGYGTSAFTPLVRKNDSVSAAPNATSIDINISSGLFNSHYDWDKASNSYKRSQGGGAHTVAKANGAEVQLQPKIVVALMMSYGIQADGKHSEYSAVGSGEAYVFQDGTVTQGTWHKDDIKAALQLTDDAGKPLALNAGQRWFVALPGADRMSYR